MTRRIVAISLVLAILPTCLFAEVDWLRRYLNQSDLTVTGSKTLAYRSKHVSGNTDMYEEDNYGQAAKYLNETNLTVTGKLFGGLNVNATFTDNRWNPNQSILTLGYHGRNTKLDVGDINASLQGNNLVPFNRRLKGIMLNQKVGKSSITGILSKTKAATRTVTTYGNNTSGPYYLSASQIIDGSERVKIDEREIPRTDENGLSNYTLDAYSGILQFRDGLVVPQGSAISISFESEGYNNQSGTLWGIRSAVPVGDKLNLGVTYLNQASGSRNAPGVYEDRQRGGHSADEPYVLRYVPEYGTVTVTVDGIPQIPDELAPDGTIITKRDYYINYTMKYLLFHRPIPIASVIKAVYIPEQDNSVSGDRSVLGFDSNFKLSENLWLEGQLARSSANYSGDGAGGNALNLKANAKLGKFTIAAGLKNIDPTYASVDSIGFMRNEKGGNFSLDYKPNDRMSFHTGYDKFSRPYLYNNYVSSADAPYIDYTNFSTGVTVQMPKWPSLSLTRTKLTNSGGLDTSRVARSLTTDALDLKWSGPSGKISIGAGFSRNDNKDDVNPHLSSLSDTSRFSLQYLPGSKLSLGLDLSGSKITEASGNAYNAKNSQLTANYMPTNSLSFTANYRISDSGNTSTANSGGYGDYVGDYAGYQNQIYVTSYGGKTVTKMLGARYSPSEKFAIDLNLNNNTNEGNYSTNTTSTGTDFGLTLMPLKWVQFMSHVSLQDMDYVGSVGGMGSKLGFFRLQLGPVRDFTLDLNYQRMLSNTFDPGNEGLGYSADMDFNLNSLTAELRRPIGHGRTAFIQYQSSDTTGYLANSKRVTALGVDFPVTKILGVTLDWRITDYNDWKQISNNYKANSFNVELGARFR